MKKTIRRNPDISAGTKLNNPCECGGNISIAEWNNVGIVWECDTCDFIKMVKHEK